MKRYLYEHLGVFLFLSLALYLSMQLSFMGILLHPEHWCARFMDGWLPWYDGKAEPVGYPGDLLSEFYVFKYLGKQFFSRGILPLWNPYAFCGTPLAANGLSGLFSPLQVFYLVFPIFAAMRLSSFIVILVGAYSLYLLLRDYGLSIIPSLFGALFYMINPRVAFNFWFPTMGASWYLLPLILLFFHRGIARSSGIYLSLAGGMLGFSILNGYLQMSIYVLLAVIIYPIFIPPAKQCARIKALIIVLALGLMISNIQIIPSLELASLSQRQPIPHQGITLSPTWHLLTAFFPSLFGAYGDSWLGAVSLEIPNWGFHFSEMVIFIGMVPMVLALYSICGGISRIKEYYLILAALALLCSYGGELIVWIGSSLPLLDTIKIVPRILCLYYLSVAVLAGFGLQRLLDSRRKFPRYIALVFAIASALPAYLWLLGYWGLWTPWYRASEAFFQHFDCLGYTYILPLLILLAVFLSLWLYAKARIGFVALVLVLSICWTVEMLSFPSPSQPRLSGDLRPPEARTPAQIRFLKADDELYRIVAIDAPGDIPVLPPNTASLYGIYDLEGYDSMFTARIQHLLNLIAHGNPYQPLPEGFINLSILNHPNHPFYDILNVKYLLCPPQLEVADYRLVYDGNTRIFLNPYALARIYSPIMLFKVKDEAHELARMFLPQALGGEMAVTSQTGLKSIFELESLYPEIIDISPTHKSIEIREPGKGMIVISDQYYPGWRATSDGRELHLYRVNGIMQGIMVSEQDTLIHLSYQPMSYRLGIYLSLLGISIFVFILWIFKDASQTR